MALKIKQNNNIHSITVCSSKTDHQKEFKISQLADDTVIFVKSIKSANIALKEINKFGNFAGPSLNIMKTNAVSMQSQEHCINELDWSEEPVKYLGIYLTKNKYQSEQLNWFAQLEKVRSILKF